MDFPTKSLVIFLCVLPGFKLYDYCHMAGNCHHIVCYPIQMLRKDFNRTHTENFLRAAMTRKMRKFILDEHNKKRNEVACGKIKDRDGQPFPKAIRMRELEWDNELEFIAGQHAEQCVAAKDDCRISSKFKRVGQNIAAHVSSNALPSALVDDNMFMEQWFDQYKYASVGEVDAVGSTKTGDKIENFTIMVNDRVTKIGCALTKCTSTYAKLNMYLFTCNYSYTNIKHRALYLKGNQAASRCDMVRSRKSSKYKCLCAYSDYQEK